ncbi:MAG: glycosyltransferase family 39 protein [Planctomycetota bacterium]
MARSQRILTELWPDRPGGRLALVLALCTALALRLAGLDWGLPGAEHFFPFHPDEWINLEGPRRMVLTGDLDPGHFNYGSLHAYLTWLVLGACQALGLLGSPAAWFLAARVPVVLLGVLSVWLMLPLGRRLGSERLGLVAAWALALCPGHALHSGWFTVDVPSICFALVATWAALVHVDAGGRRALVACGLAAGLAAATKYPAGIVVLAGVAAATLRLRADGRLTARALAPAVGVLAGSALAAFLAGVPYAVLDFPAFWRDMTWELFDHSQGDHWTLFSGSGNGWWFLLRVNLVYVMGLGALVVALPGLVLLHRRRPRGGAVLWAWAVPYAWLLGLAGLRFQRYALLLAPVLALGLAAAALAVEDRVRRGLGRRGRALPARAAALVPALFLVWPGWLCLRQAEALRGPDPRLQCARWVRDHVPEGASVGMMMHPHWFSAPITPFNAGKPAAAYGDDRRLPWDLVVLERWDPRPLPSGGRTGSC